MIRKFLLLLLLLLFGLPLAALPRIAYIGMSVLVPGSGELALGKTNRGALLLGSDLLALTGFWATERQKDDLIRSYKQYAQTYAGVPITDNDSYYQHIQQYMSSAEFNQFQELMARNYFLIYLYDPSGYASYIAANTYSPEEAWNWQSDLHFKHYRALRSKTQKTKMYQNLSLGMLILNRVVSAIDVTFISSDRKRQTPIYFSVFGEDGIMLNYRLDF